MHTRIRFILIGLSLLTVTVVLLSAYKAKAQRKPTDIMAGQAKARIIVTKTHVRPPLEVTVVKTQKRELETDMEFVDDDDWLRGLTIRLANKSGKTVTFLGMELVFWRTEEQSPGFPAAWPLRRGIDPFSIEFANSPGQPEVELALPGRALEFVLSDAQYDDIKRFLKDNEFPDSVKKVEIQVVKIGFSDGTAWNGRMYRRDPKNIKGPIEDGLPWRKLAGEGHSETFRAVREIALPFFWMRAAMIQRDVGNCSKVPGRNPHRYLRNAEKFFRSGEAAEMHPELTASMRAAR